MKKLVGLAMLVTCACTHYPMADKVKLVSFDKNVEEGQSVGPIRGEDCTWQVFGNPLGGRPTLDRAMANARTQSGGGPLDGLKGKDTFSGNTLRYINNVSTEWDGFNAGVIGKQCLVVKGTGYR